MAKLKTAGRLTILVTVPLLGMVFAAGVILFGTFDIVQNAKRVAGTVRSATAIGSLVQTLQVERGSSVGFVQSDGANFSEEVRKARTATDSAGTAFAALEPTAAILQQESYASALTKFSKLRALRDSVDSFSVPATGVAAGYTSLLNDLIQTVLGMCNDSDLGSTAWELGGYTALLAGVEEAGQERALLTRLFTQNGVSAAERVSVYQRRFAQDAYFRLARSHSRDDEAAALDKIAAGAVTQKVNALRTIIDQSGPAPFGVTPREWFDAATARIDAFYAVMSSFATDIGNFSDAVVSSSQASIVMVSIVGLIVICVSISVAVVIARRLLYVLGGEPSEAVAVATRIAQGDLQHTIHLKKNDTHSILHALAHMKDELSRTIGTVQAAAGTMSEESSKLADLSKQLLEGADSTSRRSNGVATATEQMSANMNSISAFMDQTNVNISTVAAAAEQMTSTISEIAANSEKARQITGDAVDRTRRVNTTVNQLGEAMTRIGKVTDAISAISYQTNLLALNATIEAARAGEAGKGFAVVATEIKELAKETASATEDIKGRIESIQESSSGAVQAISGVAGIIEDVNLIVSSIAASIEEQSVVTKDIASNVSQASSAVADTNLGVSQASTASGSVAQEISEVNQAAEEIAVSSSQILSSSEELSRLADKLTLIVSSFKV